MRGKTGNPPIATKMGVKYCKIPQSSLACCFARKAWHAVNIDKVRPDQLKTFDVKLQNFSSQPLVQN